jgi:hypothetical protein
MAPPKFFQTDKFERLAFDKRVAATGAYLAKLLPGQSKLKLLLIRDFTLATFNSCSDKRLVATFPHLPTFLQHILVTKTLPKSTPIYLKVVLSSSDDRVLQTLTQICTPSN